MICYKHWGKNSFFLKKKTTIKLPHAYQTVYLISPWHAFTAPYYQALCVEHVHRENLVREKFSSHILSVCVFQKEASMSIMNWWHFNVQIPFKQG